VISAKCKAAVLAIATIAALAAVPASAREDSFAALQSLDAQPLSTTEMAAVQGQAYTLAVSALLAYAALIQSTQPQVSVQYTTIASSLSTITVVTQTYYTTTTCCRILVRR
jgi:hypothetical protein